MINAMNRVQSSVSQSQVKGIESLAHRDPSTFSEKELRSVSREFESLLVQQMYKSMRSTVPKDKWLNGGMKQDIFEDMLYEQYAKETSQVGGLGLGDMVYRYLKQTAGSKSSDDIGQHGKA